MAGQLIDLRTGKRTHQMSSLFMILFLISWGTTFLALLAGYIAVRLRHEVWPPQGIPSLELTAPLINTVIVAMSSITFEIGYRKLFTPALKTFIYWLILTFILGVIFLALQSYGWFHMWSLGLKLGAHVGAKALYAGTFYFMTVFHSLHIVCGLALIVWIFPTAARGEFSLHNHQRVQYVLWFWHFVSLAWLTVLGSVYLY